MTGQTDFSLTSSDQIEKALCLQLKNIRLSRNITQTQLAKEAGISVTTLSNLENGSGITLNTFIRVLMALDIQHNLAGLLPDPSVRPMDRLQSSRSERQRARPTGSTRESTPWTWGDEEVDG